MAKERVLIVDDEPAVRKVLTRVVERIGLEAETAASGEEALALLSYGKTFDLVLLDVMLGGMDGFAVVQQLREKKNEIPIMILSARSEEDNTLYGWSWGRMIILPSPSILWCWARKSKPSSAAIKPFSKILRPRWPVPLYITAIPCAWKKTEWKSP